MLTGGDTTMLPCGSSKLKLCVVCQTLKLQRLSHPARSPRAPSPIPSKTGAMPADNLTPQLLLTEMHHSQCNRNGTTGRRIGGPDALSLWVCGPTVIHATRVDPRAWLCSSALFTCTEGRKWHPREQCAAEIDLDISDVDGRRAFQA